MFFAVNNNYSHINLDKDIQLDYLYAQSLHTVKATSIIDVSVLQANCDIFLPAATRASPGFSITFNNISAQPFSIKLYDRTTLLTTVNAGNVITIYLYDNNTQNGLWRVINSNVVSSSIQSIDFVSNSDALDIEPQQITNPGGVVEFTVHSSLEQIVDLNVDSNKLLVVTNDSENKWKNALLQGSNNIDISSVVDGNNVIYVVQLLPSVSFDEIQINKITIKENIIENNNVNSEIKIRADTLDFNGLIIDKNRNISNINSLSLISTSNFEANNIAKAWCRFTDTNNTIDKVSSFNVASVEKVNNQYQLTFEKALTNNDYTVFITFSNDSPASPPLKTRLGYDIIRTETYVTIVATDISGEVLTDCPEGISIVIYAL